MRLFVRSFAPIVCTVAFLSGCHDSSSGGGSQSALSLSGKILGDPTGPFRGGPPLEGLEGVVVQVNSTTSSDSAQATTDADGNFIVLQPPTGAVHLHVDGSGVAGGTFGALELAIVVGGGASNLTQTIVLPNLEDGETVSVPVDVNGVTMGDVTVGDPMIDGFSLDIPDMTTILLHGAPPVAPVDVNVTPVDAINTPMPLGDTLNPGAFVSIQPPEASFSPALGITLPNTGNFPLGTMVDIWSFDHGDGAWVNRSEQTGNQATVVDIGGSTFLVANEVITEGGWHAGALPVDPTCATILTGQVFTLGAPDPLADVLISLSTGQFATTDADGRFSIPSVPAYDAGALPKACVADDIVLRAIAPVAFGGNQVSMAIGAGTIVTGGTTTLAAFDIPVTNNGSLVGSVTDDGDPVEGEVSISGTSKATATSDAFGSFFVSSLEPGPYTATFTFDSGDVSEDFEIVAHETTIISLSATPVSGTALDVLVIDFLADESGVPVPDACVTLKGASGAALFATTGGNGVAAFPGAPAGPYTITAQTDTLTRFGTDRAASTVVGVQPSGNPRTIVIPFLDTASGLGGITTDATLDGTILNAPRNVDLEYQIVSGVGFFIDGAAAGTFSSPIPSDDPLQVAVTARDVSTGDIVSAVLASGLTGTTGQTLMVDFDFQNACLFDQAVPLTYTNEQAHTEFFADLEIGGLSFPFTDGSALPASVNWPDFSASKLSALDIFFDVGSDKTIPIFQESYCDVALGHSTPAALTVNFLGTPTITSPAHMAFLPTYGPGSTVSYSLGTGNGTSTGFNSITFFHEAQTADLFTFWDIFVAPNVTSLTLPPVFASKPMFEDGFVAVNVGAVRFDFPGFDFATFFDQNLAGNIAAVRASTMCEGDTSHFFNIGDPPAVKARTPAHLERHVPLAKRRFFH